MVCPCIKNAPSTAAPSSRDTCIRRQSKYHYTNKYKMSITKKRSKKKTMMGGEAAYLAYCTTSF